MEEGEEERVGMPHGRIGDELVEHPVEAKHLAKPHGSGRGQRGILIQEAEHGLPKDLSLLHRLAGGKAPVGGERAEELTGLGPEGLDLVPVATEKTRQQIEQELEKVLQKLLYPVLIRSTAQPKILKPALSERLGSGLDPVGEIQGIQGEPRSRGR